MPNAVRTDLTADEFISNAERLECCTVHTGGGSPLDELIARSNELIATVRRYLDTVQTLTETARHILEERDHAAAKCDCTIRCRAHQSVYERTKRNYDVLSALYPPPESARRTHG